MGADAQALLLGHGRHHGHRLHREHRDRHPGPAHLRLGAGVHQVPARGRDGRGARQPAVQRHHHQQGRVRLHHRAGAVEQGGPLRACRPASGGRSWTSTSRARAGSAPQRDTLDKLERFRTIRGLTSWERTFDVLLERGRRCPTGSWTPPTRPAGAGARRRRPGPTGGRRAAATGANGGRPHGASAHEPGRRPPGGRRRPLRGLRAVPVPGQEPQEPGPLAVRRDRPQVGGRVRPRRAVVRCRPRC